MSTMNIRSCSYFCTSIHIFLGFYLSIKWVVVTYVNGFSEDYFQDERMRVLFPCLICYTILFLVFGCINFIAVERESVGILKWNIRAFLLLQISMLLTNTLLAFAFPDWENDLAVHRFYHIKYMVINLIATSIYFYVVWRYVYSLENGIYEVHKKRKKKIPSSGAHGRRSTSTESQPSAPWSDSPSTSRLHSHQQRSGLHEEEEQTLPLQSSVPPEPQPGSSRS